MHRVTLPDGTRVKDKWLKGLRITAYALMCASGVLLLLSPFLVEVYPRTAETMAWFLAVGGGCCTLGAISERWVGEYVGIPLLAASFAVFGIITFAPAWDDAPYLALANLSLLMAVALGLVTRWREAHAAYRLAIFAGWKKKGEPL